jgi:5-methyltetrahydrofolate--homocysteine methyltransferase
MITYPPYFEREILPWLRRASDVLGGKGKIVATHTDGENRGLMDLIRDSGVHVAESVTPYPMTKVNLEEYYRRWRGKLTIMGGIPESLLLRESTSNEDFEAFLDNLFATLIPGDRLILGTADSTPPDADFDRLRRIADRTAGEGKLPLRIHGKSTGPAPETVFKVTRKTLSKEQDELYAPVQSSLEAGDETALTEQVQALLAQGIPAREILHHGLILGMLAIGEQFKSGDIFIPEVLLAARAMNSALAVLEPRLTQADRGARQLVLIGTVEGDMHDIGKNIVAIMLRGAGFEVHDLGVNVASEEFIRQVEQRRPHILALSALLTTTMPMMKGIISGLKSKGLREKVKVMVGGAPVNQKFADDIGADAYAGDAGTVVEAAQRILKSL